MFKSVYSAGQVSEQQAHEAPKAKIWDDGVALRFFRLQQMSEGSIDLLGGSSPPPRSRPKPGPPPAAAPATGGIETARDRSSHGARTDKVTATPPPETPSRASEQQGLSHRRGRSFRMQPRGQFETSVDAGRNETALKIAKPGRVRVRSLAARGLAAGLLAAVAGLLALSPQAEAQTVPSAPTFDEGTSTSREFDETIGEATVSTASDIGMAVAATDTDTGDTLEYTLSGTDAAKFEIITTNGQIQTKSGESTVTRPTRAIR